MYGKNQGQQVGTPTIHSYRWILLFLSADSFLFYKATNFSSKSPLHCAAGVFNHDHSGVSPHTRHSIASWVLSSTLKWEAPLFSDDCQDRLVLICVFSVQKVPSGHGIVLCLRGAPCLLVASSAAVPLGPGRLGALPGSDGREKDVVHRSQKPQTSAPFLLSENYFF